MTDGAHFDQETLELLAREREVRVETALPDGTKQRVVIWVVVDRGEPFIRSWRGDRAKWFQAALDRPDEVAIHADGRRIPVRAVLAVDDASIVRCSHALERKYAGDPATPGMVRPQVLGTTLRLEPR